MTEKELSTFKSELLRNFSVCGFHKNIMCVPSLSHSFEEIKQYTMAAISI
jgi:hypothetical protein